LTHQVLDVDYRIFGLLNKAKFHPVRESLKLSLAAPVSTMCVAAYAAASADNSRNPSAEVLSLRMKAIKMVNRSLQDVTDHVLYAVSLLWNLEVSGRKYGIHHDAKISGPIWRQWCSQAPPKWYRTNDTEQGRLESTRVLITNANWVVGIIAPFIGSSDY
jgi:hypothetical protein